MNAVIQMTVAELFDRLLEGLESGRLQGDEPVPPELLEDRHEDPVEYLARKYGIGGNTVDKGNATELPEQKR